MLEDIRVQLLTSRGIPEAEAIDLLGRIDSFTVRDLATMFGNDVVRAAVILLRRP